MPAVPARHLAVESHSEIETGLRVLLVMTHPTMRELTSELLRREGRCQVRGVTCRDQAIADAIGQEYPDLVVLDTAQFPKCCPEPLRRFRAERMIVIGPEVGESYRLAALAGGAGGWVARERLGDDLVAEVQRVLGSRPSRPRRTDPALPAEASP